MAVGNDPLDTDVRGFEQGVEKLFGQMDWNVGEEVGHRSSIHDQDIAIGGFDVVREWAVVKVVPIIKSLRYQFRAILCEPFGC